MELPTGIVKFFDDETPFSQSWAIPSHIRTLIPGGHAKNLGFEFTEDPTPAHAHYQAFMDNPSVPEEPPKEIPSPPQTLFLDTFGLFCKAKEILETPVPFDAPVPGII